jgi:hypothetical protein
MQSCESRPAVHHVPSGVCPEAAARSFSAPSAVLPVPPRSIMAAATRTAASPMAAHPQHLLPGISHHPGKRLITRLLRLDRSLTHRIYPTTWENVSHHAS